MNSAVVIVLFAVAALVAILLVGVGLLLSGGEPQAKSKKRTKSKPPKSGRSAEAQAGDDSEWLSVPAGEDPWVEPRQRGGMSWSLRLMLLSVPMAIAIVGTVMFIGTVIWFFEYQFSSQWSTVQGTVTTSYIEERVERNRRGRTRRVYDVHFEYRYVVNDETYYNRDVFFKNPLAGPMISYSKSADARSFVGRHPTGSGITVIYNPANPKRAVIERRIDEFSVVFGIGAGLVGMIVGGGSTTMGIISGLRRSRG